MNEIVGLGEGIGVTRGASVGDGVGEVTVVGGTGVAHAARRAQTRPVERIFTTRKTVRGPSPLRRLLGGTRRRRPRRSVAAGRERSEGEGGLLELDPLVVGYPVDIVTVRSE